MPDLTEVSTEALVAELRDRKDEVSIAEHVSDWDLKDECERRQLWLNDPDLVTLDGADDEQFLTEMDDRGFAFTPQEDAERLADLIAEKRTDEALDLLHSLSPGTLWPATVKRLVADRAAASLAGMLL